MDTVLKVGRKRTVTPWTDTEILTLVTMVVEGKDLDEVARHFGLKNRETLSSRCWKQRISLHRDPLKNHTYRRLRLGQTIDIPEFFTPSQGKPPKLGPKVERDEPVKDYLRQNQNKKAGMPKNPAPKAAPGAKPAKITYEWESPTDEFFRDPPKGRRAIDVMRQEGRDPDSTIKFWKMKEQGHGA